MHWADSKLLEFGKIQVYNLDRKYVALTMFYSRWADCPKEREWKKIVY